MRAYDFERLVDGQPLLVPDAGVEFSVSDLDSEDSGRDEAGFMHRSILRSGVRKWGFSYAVLSAEEYRYLMSLFAGKPTFTYSFRGMDGKPEQCLAYCSNHSISIFNERKGIYKNLKFSIIEC